MCVIYLIQVVSAGAVLTSRWHLAVITIGGVLLASSEERHAPKYLTMHRTDLRPNTNYPDQNISSSRKNPWFEQNI